MNFQEFFIVNCSRFFWVSTVSSLWLWKLSKLSSVPYTISRFLTCFVSALSFEPIFWFLVIFGSIFLFKGESPKSWLAFLYSLVGLPAGGPLHDQAWAWLVCQEMARCQYLRVFSFRLESFSREESHRFLDASLWQGREWGTPVSLHCYSCCALSSAWGQRVSLSVFRI